MLTRLGLAIFFTLNVMAFTMALWTHDAQPAGQQDASAVLLFELFRYLCLLFSLPVLFLLGGPLAEGAWDELRAGRLTTDLLLALGVAASYAYSAVSTLRGEGHVYFEVGCMVLTAVTLGRWLEATGKLKVTESLQSLTKLLPDKVRIVRDDGEEILPRSDLQEGAVIRVLAGERIPADGVVAGLRASVDEQIVTGESRPVVKETGDRVGGGTLNLDGDLLVRIDVSPDDGVLQRLQALVKAAAESKGRYQRLADRVAAWFLPLVFGIAVATFVFHWRSSGVQEAILAALAVTLIACPCALGLATPLAVWAALGRAAEQRVLFRDGDALARLAGVRYFCFDKTGTLTTGQPTVRDFFTDDDDQREHVLTIAAALASSSIHNLSQAIVRFAAPVDGGLDARISPGRGVFAEGRYLGGERWMEEEGLMWSDSLRREKDRAKEAGLPITCVGWSGRVRGVFTFREQLRPEAAETFQQLQAAGCGVGVLTGDHSAAALQRVLPDAEVRSGLSPEDKLAALESLRARWGSAAMIGDGVNDAPALAAADLGAALGCGADAARQTADVCLLDDDLSRLPWARDLAKQTVRVIRVNLFWAFAYNTLGVGLAAIGWLNPILAAIAMAASSFLVVSNSLRLRGADSIETPSSRAELSEAVTA